MVAFCKGSSCEAVAHADEATAEVAGVLNEHAGEPA
jgi:hypothetical protein